MIIYFKQILFGYAKKKKKKFFALSEQASLSTNLSVQAREVNFLI